MKEERTNYPLRLALRISNRTRTIHVVRPSALSPGRNVSPCSVLRIKSASCWRQSRSVNLNPNHIKPFDSGTPVTPVTPVTPAAPTAPCARSDNLTHTHFRVLPIGWCI